MATIFTTLIITFVLIIACVSMLGISMLLTGKSKVRLGMCGRVPTQKKGAESGCGEEFSCGLCGKDGQEIKNEIVGQELQIEENVQEVEKR